MNPDEEQARGRTEREGQARLIADFGRRIGQLRQESVPTYPPLGGRTP